MNCALWLNRRKIYRACEIPENLDVASLRGYFLAGSLVEWLRANGGGEYAEKLSELSPDDDALNQKLAAVFGSDPLPVKTFGSGSDIPPADTARFAAPPTSSLSSYPISPSYSFPRFPRPTRFPRSPHFLRTLEVFGNFCKQGRSARLRRGATRNGRGFSRCSHGATARSRSGASQAFTNGSGNGFSSCSAATARLARFTLEASEALP